MPPTPRLDPYQGHNFRVIVNGISDGQSPSAGFKEVAGLDITINAIDYRNGNETHGFRKLSGLKTFSNITCKHGATGDTEFWEWVKSGLDGAVDRREGSIVLHDENQQPVMRWNFSRGWPCKYTGPSFNAGNNEIAMESLEICIEDLELEL